MSSRLKTCLHINFLPEAYPLSSTDSNCSLKISPLSLCPALILFLFLPFHASRIIIIRLKRPQPLHLLNLATSSHEDLGIESKSPLVKKNLRKSKN